VNRPLIGGEMSVSTNRPCVLRFCAFCPPCGVSFSLLHAATNIRHIAKIAHAAFLMIFVFNVFSSRLFCDYHTNMSTCNEPVVVYYCLLQFHLRFV